MSGNVNVFECVFVLKLENAFHGRSRNWFLFLLLIAKRRYLRLNVFAFCELECRECVDSDSMRRQIADITAS
jgi:hypothetical protein